ncbi:hypothetical protein EVAR_55159_1 [Eumeta japonica]|uniref:Uncharacterized protein n=1 Tax=Eumeta variegata TaxID=151549 RepID=A0A4C1Y847_EUMVA|nr:hypothetical protein EVAR_55159_1 [Eumeta japonica]
MSGEIEFPSASTAGGHTPINQPSNPALINLAATRNEPVGTVRYHIPTVYRREVTIFAIVFRLVCERSGGAFPPPSPQSPIISLLSPSDILFLPKRPVTQRRLF